MRRINVILTLIVEVEGDVVTDQEVGAAIQNELEFVYIDEDHQLGQFNPDYAKDNAIHLKAVVR